MVTKVGDIMADIMTVDLFFKSYLDTGVCDITA